MTISGFGRRGVRCRRCHRRRGRRDRRGLAFESREPAQHVGADVRPEEGDVEDRSEEHTSELQSLMRISYAVFCLKKKKQLTPESTNECTSTRNNTTRRT